MARKYDVNSEARHALIDLIRLINIYKDDPDKYRIISDERADRLFEHLR